MGLGSTIGSVFTMAKNVTLSFAAAGIGAFSQLTAMADSFYHAEVLPLIEGMEDVRDQFGSLSSGEGLTTKTMFESLGKSFDDVGGSGRSLSSIFGHGPAGIVNRLKAMQEMVSG